MQFVFNKLREQFLELFAQYRGEAAKTKLLQNDLFGETERTVVAIRAQNSEYWARLLAHDTSLLNNGNLDDLSYSFNRPLFFTPPAEAIDFMKLFVKHFKVQSHYDVLLSTTSCSLYIDTPHLRGEGVMKAQPAYELAHPIFLPDGKEWGEGDKYASILGYDTCDAAEEINADHFDDEGAELVTPWLPWAEFEGAMSVDLGQAIANSSDCLKDDGFIVAWIPTEELRDSSVFENAGLFVEAVYVLPEQVSYGVKKESSLVIFKKGNWRSHSYVNRIPQTKERILDSFGHWNEATFAKSGGDWMDLHELNVEYNIILKWRKVEKRLQRSGLKMRPFQECFSLRESDAKQGDDNPSILLHYGKEEYVAKDFVYGTYLMRTFLKSEEGRTWEKYSKNTHPDKILFPVPSNQRHRVEGAMNGLKLAKVKMDIEELINQIWQGNSDINALVEAYDSVGSIGDFHDRLPWPLSSILRAYNVENDTRLKVDRLNYFFEATSVFIPTLLLSLIWHNDDLKLRFGSWHSDKRTSVNQNRFESPTMGAWNNLLGNLQRFLRKEVTRLGSDESALSSKLGGVSVELLKKLIDKKLFNIINDARSGRNDRAHWGALGEDEYANLLKRLKQCLLEFEAEVGYIFVNALLVSPVIGSTSFLNNETFELTVRKLIGASESFDRIKVCCQTPMVNNNVYLYTPEESDPVRVLPIIFIDERNVCHFYNRLEEEGVRYVSYQADLETNTRVVQRSELMRDVLAYLC